MPYWAAPLRVVGDTVVSGEKVKRFTQIYSNKGTTPDLGLVIILSVCLASLRHVALLDRRAFIVHILVALHWQDAGL